MTIFGKNMMRCGAAAVVAGGFAVSADAGNGALDFLDPCSKPEAQFESAVRGWDARKAAALAAIPTAAPTAEFAVKWWQSQEAAQREKFFKQNTWLDQAGVGKDKAFQAWFNEQRAKIDPGQLRTLITSDYRAVLMARVNQDNAAGDKEVAKQREDLGQACKKDVASQVLRSSLNIALAPFNVVAGNFEAAKREPGAIAQGVRATTGISITDIGRCGLSGCSSESVLNKAGIHLRW